MWLCANKDGTEQGFSLKPKRNRDEWDCFCVSKTFRVGSVEKMIGRKLTWCDEPVFYDDEVTDNRK